MAAIETETAEVTPANNMSVDALTALFSKGSKAGQEPADAVPASEHADTADDGATEQALSTTEDSADTTQADAAEPEADDDAPEDDAGDGKEPDPETDPDLDGAEADAKGKGAVNRLLKRVTGLAGKVKESTKALNAALARAETAEQRLAERGQAGDEPADGDGAAEPAATAAGQAPALAKLDARLASLREALRWCDANPDGGELNEGGQAVTYDAARVAAMKARAGDMIETLREERLETSVELKQQFKMQRETANAAAVRHYPWMNKKESPEWQIASGILRESPGLLGRPDATLLVGRYIAGLKAEQAAAKAARTKTASSAGRTPPAVVTHAGAAAPKGQPGGGAVRVAEEQFRTSGSVEDLTRLLASRQAARKAQAG